VAGDSKNDFFRSCRDLFQLRPGCDSLLPGKPLGYRKGAQRYEEGKEQDVSKKPYISAIMPAAIGPIMAATLMADSSSALDVAFSSFLSSR
jgi:hypothetical protein